jgi:hypothetical protein
MNAVYEKTNHAYTRPSHIVKSNNSLENEIRNMTYTNSNTMQGQNSEAVLLTDMSPFGVTMHESGEMQTATDQRGSQKLMNSLDTETLQVMFAESMTTTYLKNQLADMDLSPNQQIVED